MKKRADGRYMRTIVVGRDERGKRIRRFAYGYTKEELDDNYAKLRSDLNLGIDVSDGGYTVKEWARTWMKAYKSGCEYVTLDIYERVTRLYINSEIGHLRLNAVRPMHIKAIMDKCAARGLTRTLQQVRSTLSQMFAAAVENDLISRSPCAALPKIRASVSERRALTKDEIGRLRDASLSAKERAFVSLALFAGLRKGEILALQEGDIDFGASCIYVSKSVAHTSNQAYIKRPKSESGNRAVPIFEPLRPILEGFVGGGGGQLFAQRGGGPMSRTAYRAMWNGAMRKAGAPAGGGPLQVTSHMLRHTFATFLYYAGVDVKQAQAWLGHKTVRMTLDIYTHLDRSRTALSVEKLNTYFGSFALDSQRTVRQDFLTEMNFPAAIGAIELCRSASNE